MITASHTRLHTVLSSGVFLSLALTACKSDKSQQKDVDLFAAQDNTAMLEEPVERRVTKAGAPTEDDAFFIPAADTTMAFTIDGDFQDWSEHKQKSFDSKSNIVEGRKHWKGKRDTSLDLRAYADTNYIYFQFDISDDKVLSDGQDSLVINMRDPKLAEMMETLPEGVNILDDLVRDIKIKLRPDGTASLLHASTELPQDSVTFATSTSSSGWGGEVAISVEALPFVASLPMEDIAFRIEVLDGDSSREDDYQTRLEILPSPQDSPPRFILLSLDAFGGILPHMDTRGASARPDGVGYWRRDDAQWTYTSLERITTTWRYLQDTATFTKDLDTPLTCPSKDQTPSILEAYTTKSTRHRVGLILCATQADSDGTCSEDAQTQLLWVHLHRKRDEQLYSKRSELEVFDKPLSQCRRSAPKDKKLVKNFSMLPLDFVNANVWAVSWKEQLLSPGESYGYLRHATRLLNAKQGSFMGPAQTLLERTDDGDTRTETINMNYFIHIDRDDHYDICEIGRIKEQSCEDFQQGCKTNPHGEGIRRYFQLWVDDNNAFEKQLIRNHKNCPSEISLSNTPGYLLFHTGSRVGLLPSILNKDD